MLRDSVDAVDAGTKEPDQPVQGCIKQNTSNKASNTKTLPSLHDSKLSAADVVNDVNPISPVRDGPVLPADDVVPISPVIDETS